MTDEQLAQARSEGRSYREIAIEHGLSTDSVRGRVSRHNRLQQQIIVSESKIIQLDTPTVEPEPPPPSLDELNDRERWRKNLTELWHSQDTITVMHPSDRHEPFIDKIADEGVYALMSLVKPDVVVRGSDEEDNPTISYFIEEGSEEPDPGDFLDSMYQTRRYHTRRTQKIVPSAIQVSIEANHGYARLIKYVNKHAKAAKDTILRRYVDNVRCDGAVSWIGWKESVRIMNSLVVMHGKKFGVNSARQTLDMRSNSISMICGHAHRPNYYTTVAIDKTTGMNYPIFCWVGGTLSIIPAHYNDDEEDAFSLWQHSTVVATIDTKSGIAIGENVTFHRDRDRAWFIYGGKLYVYNTGAIARGQAA
jgi:hypothetical protein